MGIKIKKGVQQFMAEARSQVNTMEASEAKNFCNDASAQFIDVRDRHELIDSGKIAGAEHAARGMLEFLVDPDSPYHNKVFAQDKRFIVYCASGGRSFLAAQRMKEMGVSNVCVLLGGLKAWVMADGELEEVG